MAYKKVSIYGVGEVLIAKRRGTKNLRLSVNASGQVRVGIPYWAPYRAAYPFIKSREDWIKSQLVNRPKTYFKSHQKVGKSHTLYIYTLQKRDKRTQITDSEIRVWSTLTQDSEKLRPKIKKACEKALLLQSEKLLLPRLHVLSLKYNLPYKDAKVKKLSSRWGSCSSDKKIILSYFLVQLPWPLIDYVLLHELTHTKHLYHGPNFWSAMRKMPINVPDLRTEIKKYRPVIETL